MDNETAARFVLAIMSCSIGFLSVVIMGITQRSYKPLRLWFLAGIFLIIGFLSDALSIVINPDLNYISQAMYVLAVIILFISTLREYRKLELGNRQGIQYKPLLEKTALFFPIFLLQSVVNAFSDPIVLVEFVLFGLVLVSIVLSSKVYLVKRLPTYFFITLVLTVAAFSAFFEILSSFDTDYWIIIVIDTASVILSTLLLFTALTGNLETDLIKKQDEIQKMNNELETFFKTNASIAEQLATTAEDLSSNAEEIFFSVKTLQLAAANLQGRCKSSHWHYGNAEKI